MVVPAQIKLKELFAHDITINGNLNCWKRDDNMSQKGWPGKWVIWNTKKARQTGFTSLPSVHSVVL
jgi:hypothetical protein